jgi:transcriptional antiterminator
MILELCSLILKYIPTKHWADYKNSLMLLQIIILLILKLRLVKLSELRHCFQVDLNSLNQNIRAKAFLNYFPNSLRYDFLLSNI